MSIKKVGNPPPEDNSKNKIEEGVDEVLKAFAPDNTVFAADNTLLEHDNAIELQDDDKGPAFPDPPETKEEQRVAPQEKNMSLHSQEFYESHDGFAPAIEVGDRKTGFTAADTQRHLQKLTGQTVRRQSDGVRPAQDVDLANIDESMIMEMPEIKATAFKIMDILDPKPKDKTLRFRWANYKNFVAGNLGRYLALGFQVASVDDVDQKRTPIDPSMVDGTQIKWYDVILLKINVIRLMELYKSNIVKSVNKLERAKAKGLAEATRQFQADLSAEPGAARAYNHYKQAIGKEPVEFFATE